VNRDAEDRGCRIVKKYRNPSGRRSDNGLCDARTFAEEAQLSDLADVSFADVARFLQDVRGFDIP
jgi:hypothetical protein